MNHAVVLDGQAHARLFFCIAAGSVVHFLAQVALQSKLTAARRCRTDEQKSASMRERGRALERSPPVLDRPPRSTDGAHMLTTEERAWELQAAAIFMCRCSRFRHPSNFVSRGSTGGEDFVVVAADTRLSQGYSIHTRDCSKVTQLTDKCVIASCGMKADAITLHKHLKARMVQA